VSVAGSYAAQALSGVTVVTDVLPPNTIISLPVQTAV